MDDVGFFFYFVAIFNVIISTFRLFSANLSFVIGKSHMLTKATVLLSLSLLGIWSPVISKL